MSNSHSLSFMVMPAERRFGIHVGGLEEEEGQTELLWNLSEGKPPLRKIKEGGRGRREITQLT